MPRIVALAASSPDEPENPQLRSEFMEFLNAVAWYGDVYWDDRRHHWLKFQLHVPAIQRSYDAEVSYNCRRHTAQITVPLPVAGLGHRDKDVLRRLQGPLILSRMDFRDTKLFLQAGSICMGNGDTATVLAAMIGELRSLISNGDIQANIRE